MDLKVVSYVSFAPSGIVIGRFEGFLGRFNPLNIAIDGFIANFRKQYLKQQSSEFNETPWEVSIGPILDVHAVVEVPSVKLSTDQNADFGNENRENWVSKCTKFPKYYLSTEKQPSINLCAVYSATCPFLFFSLEQLSMSFLCIITI